MVRSTKQARKCMYIGYSEEQDCLSCTISIDCILISDRGWHALADEDMQEASALVNAPNLTFLRIIE